MQTHRHEGHALPAHVAEQIRTGIAAARERAEPFCAYVHDTTAIAEGAGRLRAALPDACTLLYAIKANSRPEVLRALAPRVDGFEISSVGELRKARAADAGARVVFNGPGKTWKDIEEGLRAGVDLFNVESTADLARLDAVAGRLGTRARVQLRVNTRRPLVTGTRQMVGVATQFGVDEEQLPEVIAAALAAPHIEVEGLHLHSVSNNTDAASHLAFVDSCLALAAELRARHGVPTKVLDIGGGFGVDYTGAGRHFAWDDFAAGLHERAEALTGTELVIEPGRSLVADHGYYCAEVLDLKHNHGQAFAVLRGGIHQFRLPAVLRADHPFAVVGVDDWPWPLDRPEIRDSAVALCGELGTPADVLTRAPRVGLLRAGDVVVFPLAGAYGWEISHRDFLSHPHPDFLTT
ncbi:alanine racemase [Streptomyces albireticuli]|uniref:Orn/DAP/Arg decarboxylase 2 N-terminal domain-containing protein n=1 Tax=Streptomyces albireticuli TaxID=1940 RepID=A0A2A2D0Y3_9ACTN|nr:alanine racemase [Streptomyces albireticuli]MCD9194310.1 alanine racemase [Streptomyces albireticuli]PAU45117.1 hypothetical protein CK936_31180 [Streptomyces albireticuli]